MHPAWRWIGVAIFFSLLWGLMCFAEPCVLHDKQGKPTADPCGLSKLPKVTYTVSAADRPHADDDVALIGLLHQELAEMNVRMVDIQLQRKINALMLKIQKEYQRR